MWSRVNFSCEVEEYKVTVHIEGTKDGEVVDFGNREFSGDIVGFEEAISNISNLLSNCSTIDDLANIWTGEV